MRRGMRKTRGLKVRLYDALMIYLNSYLDVFPGEKSGEKCEAELNIYILNVMLNRQSSQAYVKGFYFEYITSKYVNMFEIMETE